MRPYKYLFACILFGLLTAQGQYKKSKGDGYFFSYAFEDAILAYENDLADGEALSPKQYLNLADSYFKVEKFDKATEIYLRIFEEDSIMGDYHLNKLLQGLERDENGDKLRSFLESKNLGLSSELQENAEFNSELLNSGELPDVLDFKVFNLESNSAQSDFSPSFYGTNLLFTSGRVFGKRASYKPTGEAYLDIFEGQIGSDGQVTGINKFMDIKSSDFHKATPYFSEDLNSIFYVLSNTFEGELEFDENGKNALGIGMQKIGGDFQFLWRDLSTSFYYPFYDHSSSRLYFAANFEDGYGGTDIYYVNTSRGQIMSAPINLGPRVNTPGNEIAPFVFEGTLYFSSDIFYGMGGMDIYKSNFDESLDFGIPVNLGNQINSDDDDFGFIIRNEGEGLLGYFSSNRAGGKGGDDIYGFLVDEKPGIKTLTVSGKVLRTGSLDVVAGATVWISNPEGETLKVVFADEEGNYRIELPWQENVVLNVANDRFSNFKQSYDAPALEQLQKSPKQIYLTAYDDIVEEKENQVVIKLRKFYFEKGKSEITPDIAIELNKVVEAVKAFPAMELRIETHSDSRGGSSYNFGLTQARSDAIKKYLLEKGVRESNILYSVGYGEDKLLNQCKNGVYCLELQHQENQRSLIAVLNDNILFD